MTGPELAVYAAQIRQMVAVALCHATRAKAGQHGGHWLDKAKLAERWLASVSSDLARAERSFERAQAEEREEVKRRAEREAIANAPPITESERVKLSQIRERCLLSDGVGEGRSTRLVSPFGELGADANAFRIAMELGERTDSGAWKVAATFGGARAHAVRAVVLGKLSSLTKPSGAFVPAVSVVRGSDEQQANRL